MSWEIILRKKSDPMNHYTEPMRIISWNWQKGITLEMILNFLLIKTNFLQETFKF